MACRQLAKLRDPGGLYAPALFLHGPIFEEQDGIRHAVSCPPDEVQGREVEVREELVQVDRELAHAPIDLKFLSWKAEKRIKRAAEGSNGTHNEGGGGGDSDCDAVRS